jgi:hypothetical protein
VPPSTSSPTPKPTKTRWYVPTWTPEPTSTPIIPPPPELPRVGGD